MAPADLALGALRWLEYVGLLAFVGVVVLRLLAANPPAIPWARPRMQLALAAAVAGGLGTLFEQWLVSRSLPAAVLVRVLAEVAALVLCMTIGRGAVPAGFVAAFALAFGGHATAVVPPAPAILIDAVHIVSAGMWAGGILVLPVLHPPGGWRSDEARSLLQRYGRVAVVAFALTALTGVIRATDELRGVADLWTTAYGLVLTAKSVGVGAMLVMSAIAWRRGIPLARAEAAIAVAVMGATGLLAAFPMPPAGA